MEFPHHLLISIHAPLAGCDGQTSASGNAQADFNPRTPCGVRLVRVELTPPDDVFQSTHPLRGATLVLALHFDFLNISIHAPLAGCDLSTHIRVAAEKNFNPRTPCGVRLAHERYSRAHRDISIHAPLAGCDSPWPPAIRTHTNFNPRTPCGVRQNSCYSSICQSNFNPRTPCGVRRRRHGVRHVVRVISIHAPLAGCDHLGYPPGTVVAISIHAPLAGCDGRPYLGIGGLDISIHAPLAGCDMVGAASRAAGKHFNPRTPCGVRRATVEAWDRATVFQSTHPLRGATFQRCPQCRFRLFQSTHPLRGATVMVAACLQTMQISIHAPLAGCDAVSGWL